MQSILARLLKKRGVESVDKMTPEEKLTFVQYEAVLSKKELTLEDLKIFLTQQIQKIESKWADMTLGSVQKAELIPYHTVYRTLLQTISAPEVERVALEKVLTQMINS